MSLRLMNFYSIDFRGQGMRNSEFIKNLDGIFLSLSKGQKTTNEAALKVKQLVQKSIDFSEVNEISQSISKANEVLIEMFPDFKDLLQMGLGDRPESLKINKEQILHSYCHSLLEAIAIFEEKNPVRCLAKGILEEIPINWPLPTSPFEDSDPYMKFED